MRNRTTIWAALLAVVLGMMPQAAVAKTGSKSKHHKVSSSNTKRSSAKRSSAKRVKHSRRGAWRHRGQQTVDGRRTEQIQEALIESHYLDGEPSGAWDAKTQEALRRYQAANGWQSKVVPDSRALIKLGLGPSNEKLLNPNSAMTSRVEAGRANSQ